MTSEQIAELRALNADASKAWGFGDQWGPDDRKPYVCVTTADLDADQGHVGNLFDPADARLVVAARNALTKLLDEREALLQAVREAMSLLEMESDQVEAAWLALKEAKTKAES